MTETFKEEFKELCEQVRTTTEQKGFETSLSNFPEKIALIHSEASEALEDYRNGREDHIPQELADIVIRVMDLAEGIDADLPDEIVKKIEHNQKRDKKHGGKNI